MLLAAALPLAACDLRDQDLPALYRRMEVPANRLASPDVQRQGRAIYRQQCAACHGEQADGKGPRAAELTPPPRDLMDVAARERLSERHLYYAIAEGGHGTPMPPWKATLSPGEIWSLVAYVRSLASVPPPTDVPAAEPSSAPPGAAGQDRR